jgi:DNA (cytosine-5)-methyltransferase 1
MECRWQFEIDPYCRRVLENHWPNVTRYEDVRKLPLALECVDLIAGGFPCQPVSVSGKRKGEYDERWLWPEFGRIIRLLRPQFVLIENVPGLLGLGFDCVLRDLASCGYDAEWSIVSACSLGAPHMRKRLFVVAYPQSFGCDGRPIFEYEAEPLEGGGSSSFAGSYWSGSPINPRTAYGVPRRVDRVRGLGNAVVPQVAEWIGRRIIAHDRSGVDRGVEGVADERTGVRRPSAGRLPWS